MVLPSFPEKITLWKEGRLAHVDFPSLVSFLAGKREGLVIEGPLEIWSRVAGEELEDSFAAELAGSRVLHVDTLKTQGDPPLRGEVEVERRMLREIAEPIGMLYDATLLAASYAKSIAIGAGTGSLDPHALHIVVTYRLFGTFDVFDRRYHARTCFFALPSVISTTGLVVAPAKPREYYLARRFGAGRVGEADVLRALEGRFLDHEDRRTTEVMKGYLLQAILYHAAGTPFCDDRKCRLFNAHWQEELLEAQIGEKEDLCPAHRALFAGSTGPGTSRRTAGPKQSRGKTRSRGRDH
jgi:hypothetical protein